MRYLFVILPLIFFVHTAQAVKTDAVVEMAQTHISLLEKNELVIKEFVKIRILNEEGYINAVYQDYYDTFRRIRSLHYSLFDANGKRVKKFVRGDAADVMLNPSYHIDDTRMLILDPDYKRYPFTVEIEVEIAYNGFINFPLWMPRHRPGLEIKTASLQFQCYKDYEFKYRQLNDIPPPVMTEVGGIKTMHWTIENLPAVDQYENFKVFFSQQGKVYLTPVDFSFGKTTGNFRTWENFGEWFINLNEGRNGLGDVTKKHLEELRNKHAGDTVALVKAVYQYMQGKTRYISIQLGIGGYQSIPADEVDANGYGDCKALTNYMKSMLEYMGISSNYILVYAGSDAPDIQHDFPSNQFNHLFLGVPVSQDTLWFECTSQTLPPAHIGTFTDDRYVLWIEKNNSRIIRTPAFTADESILKEDCNVTLSSQGDAALKLELNQSGMFFEEAMMFQLANKSWIEKSNREKFHYPDFTIHHYNFNIPDPQKPVLHLMYSINVHAIGKPLGTKMVVPSNFLIPLEKKLDIDLVNKFCEIRRPFTIEDHVVVELPENYRIDVLPEILKEESPFVIFEMKIEQGENDQVHIYRKIVVQKGIYQKEDFDRFSTSLKKIRQIEQSRIVLQSKT